MEDPKPCPICGAKAYVRHDVVAGLDFGWSAGCHRFRLYDGIHGMDVNTPESDFPVVMYCNSKKDAIEKWNRRVSDVRISDNAVQNRPVDSVCKK